MTSSERLTERPFGHGELTLADAGEEAVLDALMAVAAPRAGAPRSGDDAAVWTPRAGHDLAVSIDALVENIDFQRAWITPRQLGRRAFAVAVSDLAGTGAAAVHCVATVCVRASDKVDDVLEIQRGLCAAADDAGCTVIGGDVSAIDGPLVVDVCVVGELPSGRALRRSAGRTGDLLVCTGRLGRAAAGLRLLLEGMTPADVSAHERSWIAAQLDPPQRLREGRQFLDAGVSCAGDISDGLAVDAARTARSSGCAAELWVDCLPLDLALPDRFGQDWLQLAIAGGEDFELLATMSADLFAVVGTAWPAHLAPLTVVGRLCEGEGIRLLAKRGGAALDLPPVLSRHFASPSP